MIDRFKVDYYYKYLDDDNHYFWTDMNLVLDNKWHKCIKIYLDDDNYAKFENMKYGWPLDKNEFIESKYPPKLKVKKLLKEI